LIIGEGTFYVAGVPGVAEPNRTIFTRGGSDGAGRLRARRPHRARFTVRVEGATVALLESTARQLGLAGLRVNEAPRPLAIGYRDSPSRSRSLTQSEGPALERVRELRVWVEDGRTLRYVAHALPSVFEPLLLACAACIVVAAWPGDRTSPLALAAFTLFALLPVVLWNGHIHRARRMLRDQIDAAVGHALAERGK
jgi:hypothetical protein